MDKRNSLEGSYAEQLVAALEIDADASTPLYVQVRNGLTRLIKTRYFGADVALPSERALAAMLGISRVTTRKAIDALNTTGLIVRRHGSGNYIAPQVNQPSKGVASFTQELTSRGYMPGIQWISREVGPVLPKEMMALNLASDARVARFERVRLADDTPMAVAFSTLPVAMTPEPEAVTDSLYAFLARNGSAPVRALQTVRAMNATPQHADLLKIPVGSALLFMTRVGYLEDDRAIELTHIWCRSDFYDVVMEL